MNRNALRYDLHSHSTASDGELSPTELVEHAKKSGVNVLALTDHDTVGGIAEATAAARQHGITLIPGVEISITWNRRLIHIVALGIDPQHSELSQGLQTLRQQRETRAEEIGRRLKKKGIEGALEGAQRLANGATLSRTHFARFLLEQGHIKGLQQAFDRYLGEGKPAYVPSRWITLEQCLTWIHNAGGQAVIAHPARYKMTATKLRRLLSDFKKCGGVAIEVISGSQGFDVSQQIAQQAIRFELLASVGSDYHGPSQSWLKMGHLPALPEGCHAIWEAWERRA